MIRETYMNFRNIVAATAIALFLSGCAGSSDYMQVVEPAQVLQSAPADASLIVFQRPSGFGFAVQSSVFEVTEGMPQLIGIVSAKTRIAYVTAPGNHRYMVIGENAAFLDAELLPGRTYYAIVSPRIGFWKARFALVPVHADELRNEAFRKQCNSCNWVVNTPASLAWANANMASILEKKSKYLPGFLEKPDRPTLAGSDGE